MRFSKSNIAISRQCLTNTLKQLPWLVLLCCWKPFDTWAEALQNHWSEILLYLSALNRLQWDTCKEKSEPRPVHMSENAPRRGNASAVHLQSFYSVIPATKFSLSASDAHTYVSPCKDEKWTPWRRWTLFYITMSLLNAQLLLNYYLSIIRWYNILTLYACQSLFGCAVGIINDINLNRSINVLFGNLILSQHLKTAEE